MRAAIFTEVDQPLVIEDVTLAEPGPSDVIVNIGASGVCHSDLSFMNGTVPFPPPAILGHEGAGVVVDVEGISFPRRLWVDIPLSTIWRKTIYERS